MTVTSKALFSVSDYSTMGAKAFANSEPRPEGTTWQAKAKQKGYDTAMAQAQVGADNASNAGNTDAFFEGEAPKTDAVEKPMLDVTDIPGVTVSVQELIKQKHELDTQIANETAKALDTVKFIIAEFGFGVTDVFMNQGAGMGAKTRASKGTKVAPKYRNPENGATWTGRGKAPLWIANKDKDSFLIQK